MMRFWFRVFLRWMYLVLDDPSSNPLLILLLAPLFPLLAYFPDLDE